MTTAVRASIHKIITAAVHLWVATKVCDDEERELPTTFTACVWSRNMDWGSELLKGKRIRVTMTVEDDTPLA